MTWDYRVLRRTLLGPSTYQEDEFAVYEVYYDEAHVPTSCSTDPQFPRGETVEELKSALRRYGDALDKPVLKYGDFDAD